MSFGVVVWMGTVCDFWGEESEAWGEWSEFRCCDVNWVLRVGVVE